MFPPNSLGSCCIHLAVAQSTHFYKIFFEDYTENLESVRMAVPCRQHCMSKEAITNTEVTDEQTLLQVVLNGHLDCMDSLISAGVDVNATDDNGDTALIHVVRSGLEQCVRH